MNKSMVGLIAIVIAIAVCSACSIATTPKLTRGFDINPNHVNSIVKGRTTESEIIKMFGPPAKYRMTETGKEFLYDYAKAGGEIYFCNILLHGGTKQKSLLVIFNKEGVVIEYVYKES
jgi:outer membrane protein assembly factor BamE (lipoprotein component of BamABCDE complex)